MITSHESTRLLWGPPHDQPKTFRERRQVTSLIDAILLRYPGVTLAETGIERRAGQLDPEGYEMEDIAVVYVTFPGGECAARCTRGDVASFYTKRDRAAWGMWQSSRSNRTIP